MAQISASIRSQALGFTTHIQVIIPQQLETPLVPPEKILYLLHGLSGDSTAWCHHTRIYHYAEKHNYMVVMPEVQRSFYSDMAYGSKYFTYVSDELPAICEKLFNIKHKREKTFVAGKSMGGFGAAKCALSRPDFYAAGACFSGALDMKTRVEEGKKNNQLLLPETRAILGEGLVYPDTEDLFHLATCAAKHETKPRLLITCGDSDFLLGENIRFDAHLASLNYGHTYKQWPGDHNWDFWEECLPMAFEFFNTQMDTQEA